MRPSTAAGLILLAAAFFGAARPETAYAQGQWQTVSDEGGSYWSYLKEDGTQAISQKEEIGGKIYFFDDKGHMMYGWITADGEWADEGDGTGYAEGMYYCGSPEEGWAATGWKYLEIFRTQGGRERRWFYFKDSGKKVADTSITEEDENGRYRYSFDSEGILKSSKKIGSFTAPESGQWIKRIPAASQDGYANANKIERWYYGLPNGKVVKGGLKTIGGKEYLFDSAGIMRTGLVAVNRNKTYEMTLISPGSDADCSIEDLEAFQEDYVLMYFDETTGVRCSGKAEITVEGEEKPFLFDSMGRAVRGEYKGRLYCAGLLKTADPDLKYEILTLDDHDYLVDSFGKVLKNGSYQDKNGDTWTVRKENGSYVIEKQ